MQRHAYPKRTSHFAHKFVRMLTKVCAAQEIGPEGFCLLTIIVHQEDSKRYGGPVLFYNEQLAPLCGFSSLGRLKRTRAACVEAGWLHYEEGGKRTPGRYWVTMPDVAQPVSDEPVDQEDESISRSIMDRQAAENRPTNDLQTADKRPETDREAIDNRHANGPLSYLSLEPNPDPGPNTNTALPPAAGPPPTTPPVEARPPAEAEAPREGKLRVYDLPGFWDLCEFPPGFNVPLVRTAIMSWIDRQKSTRRDTAGDLRLLMADAESPESFAAWLDKHIGQRPNRYSEDFEEFWQCYPRRVDKAGAYRAWKRAMQTTLPEKIMAAVRLFAESGVGKSGEFCPYAERWLNGRRWEDDPGAWVRHDNGGNGNGRSTYGQAAGDRHVYRGPVD